MCAPCYRIFLRGWGNLEGEISHKVSKIEQIFVKRILIQNNSTKIDFDFQNTNETILNLYKHFYFMEKNAYFLEILYDIVPGG